jgi:hypothetical protein
MLDFVRISSDDVLSHPFRASHIRATVVPLVKDSCDHRFGHPGPTRQKNVRQKNRGSSYFSVSHFSVWCWRFPGNAKRQYQMTNGKRKAITPRNFYLRAYSVAPVHNAVPTIYKKPFRIHLVHLSNALISQGFRGWTRFGTAVVIHNNR